MTSIDEELNGLPEVETIDLEGEQVEQYKPSMMDLLKSPTGEGDVEDYKNHVLNFNHSMSMARIIRGLTGIFGNLNYAVVDIAIGALDFFKPKQKEIDTDAYRGVRNI